MEDGFRGPQVCAIVGITYRQLDYWARTNLLRPSIAEARGSGTCRLYSFDDLVELKVIKALLGAGVSLQQARRAIRWLRDRTDVDDPDATLVLNGITYSLAFTPDEVMLCLRSEPVLTWLLPLGALIADLRETIERPVAA